MPRPIVSNKILQGFAVATLIAGIALAIAAKLGPYADRLWFAVLALDTRWLLLALVLSMIHRVLNTLGWTLTIRAMGHPLSAREGVRIWLASEAFRWLPGSFWSYSSRGVLAARAGVPPAIAAASIAGELLSTVLAWSLVAALGLLCWAGPIPPLVEEAKLSLAERPWISILVIAVIVTILAFVGLQAARRKFANLAASSDRLVHSRAGWKNLVGVLLFQVAMVLMSSLAFWLVLRSAPGGDRCPSGTVLATNAIAWLIGLFTLFAPGGLVVREATIGTLLAGTLSAELAITIALGWRAVQVAAELLCSLALIPVGKSSRCPTARVAHLVRGS